MHQDQEASSGLGPVSPGPKFAQERIPSKRALSRSPGCFRPETGSAQYQRLLLLIFSTLAVIHVRRYDGSRQHYSYVSRQRYSYVSFLLQIHFYFRLFIPQRHPAFCTTSAWLYPPQVNFLPSFGTTNASRSQSKWIERRPDSASGYISNPSVPNRSDSGPYRPFHQVQ
ncbi:hypothetical protein B0H11DRAFT_1340812 [Mycena galericulata]|nr:hypothetical protein B0H11DRAFT_1340812 [Mycena galericulata]